MENILYNIHTEYHLKNAFPCAAFFFIACNRRSAPCIGDIIGVCTLAVVIVVDGGGGGGGKGWFITVDLVVEKVDCDVVDR